MIKHLQEKIFHPCVVFLMISYEVDDARGQSNWTPDFFNEFKNKRGYDLKNELPALFANDNSDRYNNEYCMITGKPSRFIIRKIYTALA